MTSPDERERRALARFHAARDRLERENCRLRMALLHPSFVALTDAIDASGDTRLIELADRALDARDDALLGRNEE